MTENKLTKRGDFLRKVLCFLGLHHHIEIIDRELTRRWLAFCPPQWNPTPCSFLECKYCGHTYECRTVGISGRLELKNWNTNENH